jgi:hypothetical protein
MNLAVLNLADAGYGLSTGWDPATRTDYPAAAAAARSFSSANVELSALSCRDLPALAAYLGSKQGRLDVASFGHVSLHGPAKHLPSSWENLVGQLSALPVEGIDGIVLHPDTVTNFTELEPVADRLVFENMDCRKTDCRTAQEMARVFDALPDARFCLDVAHVWTIDRSLAEGDRLLDAFEDRLAQVHLSGIDPGGQHRITAAGDLLRYRPLLERCRHVPWVLESPLA